MSSPLCRHRNDFASHLSYYMLPTTTSSVSGTRYHHHLYMQKLCRVFIPKASVLFVYFSLRYRPRKIMRCFLLNETNQNKAVAVRTTRSVRQGFVCKHRFFNVFFLLRCCIFYLFLVFGFLFFLCVCAIPRKWLQMKSNHVVIIGKRKQVIQSSERLQLEPCYILAPVKISLFLVVTERSNAAIQLFKWIWIWITYAINLSIKVKHDILWLKKHWKVSYVTNNPCRDRQGIMRGR